MARTTIDYGIDLGTTNSSIALLCGSDTAIIQDAFSGDIVPSVVAVNDKGRKQVGLAAKNCLVKHPDWGAQEFKRQMGSDWRHIFATTGEAATPEQLSAQVLQVLRENVQEKMAEAVEAAVITIPAIFNNPECEATRRAAELAGLKQTPLLQEPVAAALAYGFQSRTDNAFWLVYDLGGGTFDAAVVQVRDEMIHVVNHDGDRYLGGKDIDLAIVEHILIPAIHREFGNLGISQDDERWRPLIATLKAKAEEAKIILSKKREAVIDDVYFSKDGRPEGNLEFCYELTRAEVEREAEPRIARSIAIARRVLAAKRLGPDHIEKLLLAGGPTFMPYLRNRLADPKQGLGISLEFSINPLTVVARGAAVFAGTQRVERDGAKPLARGVASLSLEFASVGRDLEPPIGGKASLAGVKDFRGYTVEFVRPGWRGGKVPLSSDGTFYTGLFVESEGRTEFEIRLADVAGSRLATDPDKVVYTVGISISEQPLTATAGVGLANGDFHPLIAKGTPLPAKGRRTYLNSIGVFPRDNKGCILVPLRQGEHERACRNLPIGTLEIRPDQVGREVPAGSEIEILLEVDASQIFHLKAYVPILDQEFPAEWRYHRPTLDLLTLRQEYECELERFAKLEEQARATGQNAAQADLDAITALNLLDEIERLLEAAEGDQDALERAQHRLLDLQLALDAVEEALNWPTLVEQANKEMQLARKDLEGPGKDDDRREAREIERELKAVLQTKDADGTRNRLEALSNVRFRVLAREPGFWVGWFQWCEERKSEVRDPAVASKLLAQGNRALQNNDLDALKSAVRQLLDQMPEREQKQIQQGFGSTLMRADNG